MCPFCQVPQNRPRRRPLQAQVSRGRHDLPVGVPAEAAAGQELLPQDHQVDQPGEGRVPADGQQGGLAALGPAQEQARHELRDDGQGIEVSCTINSNKL